MRIYAVTDSEMGQLSWMHPTSAVLAGIGVNLLSSYVMSPAGTTMTGLFAGIVFVLAAGFIQAMAWRMVSRIKSECSDPRGTP
ncbi:MAG TPA: hypothetical protein VK176_01695 [Phycisphaerales bacterium]|nr:hypothetical protein [Phycisphaerales bacterium]